MATSDKTEEEIPSVTLRTGREYAELIEKLRWKPTEYRIVEFPISDLLKAEKLQQLSLFQFEDLTFRSVKIKGRVLGTERIGTKLLITVTDGTAQIDCYLEPKQHFAVLKKNVDCNLNRMVELRKSVDDLKVEDKAALMLLFRCKKKIDMIPLFADLTRDDMVTLTGNLHEFEDGRSVFVKHIFKILDPEPFRH